MDWKIDKSILFKTSIEPIKMYYLDIMKAIEYFKRRSSYTKDSSLESRLIEDYILRLEQDA